MAVLPLCVFPQIGRPEGPRVASASLPLGAVAEYTMGRGLAPLGPAPSWEGLWPLQSLAPHHHPEEPQPQHP